MVGIQVKMQLRLGKEKEAEEEKKKKEEAKKREEESKENLKKIREQNRKSRASMFAQNNNNGSASVGIKVGRLLKYDRVRGCMQFQSFRSKLLYPGKHH